MTTIILAGPSGLYNDLLKDRLNSEDGLRVLYGTSKTSDLVIRIKDLKPDILIIDLTLHHLDFRTIFETINEFSKETRILFLVPHENEDIVFQMLCSGIHGCINTNADFRFLLEAITNIKGRRIWTERDIILPPLKRGTDQNRYRYPGWDNQMTQREIEISGLIIKGLSNKAISKKLLISEKTVKVHIGNIFKKLGITHRYQLSPGMVTKHSILRVIKARS